MNRHENHNTRVGGLGPAVTTLVAVFLLTKFIWGWIIPDLFPGAVTHGLVTNALSWGGALKIGFLAGILTYLIHHMHRFAGTERHQECVLTTGPREA